MRANHWALATLSALGLVSFACQTNSGREAERRRVEKDRGSAAYKAGEEAHKAAREAAKLAAAAGRKLDEGARKAREGWKEEGHKDR